MMPLVGKWFVFWPVSVRLFVAGLRQGALFLIESFGAKRRLLFFLD
jgi:hypothetical protein